MRTWILALAATLTLGTAAQALYREWGAWKPGENISASFWPKGAYVLANRKERVGGHMLNAFDHFRFRGDAAALNAFLSDTGAVRGSRSVLLVGGGEQVGFVNPRLEGADWSLSISGNSHVGVFIPADDPIRARTLRIPVGLPLEGIGDLTAEVRRLVADHEVQRKAATQPKQP